jgi:hypothetical protein
MRKINKYIKMKKMKKIKYQEKRRRRRRKGNHWQALKKREKKNIEQN